MRIVLGTRLFGVGSEFVDEVTVLKFEGFLYAERRLVNLEKTS